MIFTDVIAHDELGSIQVYWDDRGKIKECTTDYGSHLDMMACESSAAEKIPVVYEYLANFGKYETPPFSPDVFDFSGFSDFTVDVYKTLFSVPKGVLVTYGELAEMAGYPRAARAVGSAMRKNKFLMLVPCHRVVASNSLGGFITGLDVKIKLLELEEADLSWLKY